MKRAAFIWGLVWRLLVGLAMLAGLVWPLFLGEFGTIIREILTVEKEIDVSGGPLLGRMLIGFALVLLGLTAHHLVSTTHWTRDHLNGGNSAGSDR